MRINFSRAFTLVEMLVSLGIVTFLMSVILFNYSPNNDKLTVSTQTEEMTAVIRQAQVYGLSVREASVGTGIFDYGYGVFFDTTSGQNDKYILFIDKLAPANNGKYDAGSGVCGSATTECVEQVSLRNAVKITTICDVNNNCPPVGATRLHITFKRPNPDAVINFTNSSNSTILGAATKAKITLISVKNANSSVTVEANGQILAN